MHKRKAGEKPTCFLTLMETGEIYEEIRKQFKGDEAFLRKETLLKQLSINEIMDQIAVEIVGKEYMLTAKVYEALKSDVEYTRDKTVQYIKAKNMILEYLQTNDQITSAKIQEMCGFTKQQARSVIDKMRSEDLITLTGKGPAARYVMYK